MLTDPTLLTLAADDARLDIAPATGGAIAAFTYRDVDVLRPTADDVRAKRDVRGHACYPLIPYSNRIADARLRFDGRGYLLQRNFGDHPHSIHGVGWQREWTIASRENDNALLTLDYAPDAADATQATAWPWPFRAMQSFALASTSDGARLMMRLTLLNTSNAAFPFGLGWHPFFPRNDKTELGFVAQGVWETDSTQLPTRHVAIPADWRFDPPQTLPPATIDNVFTDWSGSAVLDDRQRGIGITIEADRACRFLVVYVPAARDYLAIEPVTHMTDAFNRAATGESDTGTRILQPGAAFSTTMRISVRSLR